MRYQAWVCGAAILLCALIGIALTPGSPAASRRAEWGGALAAPARPLGPSPTPACGPPGSLGAWAVVSPVPQAAAAIGVTSDGIGAYAAGGLSPGLGVLNRFARYDPATDSWTSLLSLPVGADGVGLVSAPGLSRIYAFGGADTQGNSLTSAFMYDRVANTWTALTALPGPRSRAATVYYNGSIFLIGGGTTRNPASGQTQTWEYGLAANTWNTTRAPLPAARVAPAYAAVNGHIYVIGGLDVNGAATSTVYEYDIAADTWTPRTALPVAVAGPASALAGGRVVVAGGGTPTLGAQAPLTTTLTQIYDPVADSWSSGPPLNVGRSFVGGAAVGAYLVTVGGADPLGAVYSATEVSQILGPCPTATDTPAPRTPTATATFAPTATATPVPGICYTYGITAGTGRILPGSADIGNHCDDCFTEIDLPFFVPLYDGPPIGGPDGPPIMKGRLSSNGYGIFSLPTPTPTPPSGAAPSGGGNVCLPAPGFAYTIFPHWDDLRTDCAGCGIFTATVGCAPARTFVIEWRASYVNGGGLADFALELREGRADFDMVYGPLAQDGAGATVGIQRDGTTASQFECDMGGLHDGLRLTFTRQECGVTPSPTPTPAPSATPTACAVSFSDVPVGDPFYGYIRCLACQGILSGYADGTFRPGNAVTRGQLAKIMANSAGFAECIPPQPQVFADVDPANPFWLFIQRNALYQVISGYTCGGPGEPCDSQHRPYFRPSANVTRGQVAKIAAGAAGFDEAVPSTQQTFADVPPGSVFWLYVERLSSRGIISGYACGGLGEPCDSQRRPYYRPGGTVTRAQTAKIASITFFPSCPAP